MSRLRRSLRSAGALALVVGFYVLAVVLIGGYAVFGVVMSRVVFDPEGELGLPLLLTQISFAAAALVMLPQLIMGVGRGAGPRPGTAAVDLDDAFGLWETVLDLADRIGVPAPTEIRLTMEANAAVSEQAGGRGGTWERRLYVGVPLLAGLRADELRAVLAHELAHYAQGHTRFAATVYRGAIGLDAARESFAKPEAGNPIVTVYTGFQYLTLSLYAWLYNVLSFAVRRRQELEADATSAAVAGRDTAVQALMSVETVAAAWQDFRSRVLTPMAVLGRLPDDPVRAFDAVLTDPQYARTWVRQVAGEARHPVAVRHPFDSHPPLKQRLDALRALPEGQAEPDLRPAYELVNDEGALPHRVLAALLLSRTAGRERLTRPWPDWLTEAAEVRAVRAVEELDPAMGLIALARPTTDGVLDLLTGGRGGELAEALRDTGWGERWEAAPSPHSPNGARAEECRWTGGSWWTQHMADRWQERGESPSEDRGGQGPYGGDEQREADARRAVLALELLAGQALVAAGRARWVFHMHGPGRAVSEDPAATEALELVPAALTDPNSAERLRTLLLLCGVSLETELSAAGSDSALRIPPASAAPEEPEGKPARPAFPVAVFLMALVALLLFTLRWDMENKERSRPPLPSLPDRYPPPTPLFHPTCPPGHITYGDLCVRISQPQPTR
ncbi:M48 family metallopeptidase [Streptomyces sp. TRM49041]|uniref:M48 family metallopeptidase n=1 Tax=Streptomyces sp. TRM49041 TaxID=2603216 RepID=UPI0011EDAE92|nr:M48 family metallopeptidase [Streptomyces sp. TRM49041]